MADIVPNSDATALAIARVLADHNGAEVVVLNVAAQAGWTDRFVIATATSTTHLRGLARFVDEELAQLGLARLNRSSFSEDDEWLLIDLGTIVVHIMTEGARSFYELEKLWFQSPATTVAPTKGAPVGQTAERKDQP